MVFAEIKGKWKVYEGKLEIYKLKYRPKYFNKKKEEFSEERISFLVNLVSVCFFEIGRRWMCKLGSSLVFWSPTSECENMLRQMWINAVWKFLISTLHEFSYML